MEEKELDRDAKHAEARADLYKLSHIRIWQFAIYEGCPVRARRLWVVLDGHDGGDQILAPVPLDDIEVEFLAVFNLSGGVGGFLDTFMPRIRLPRHDTAEGQRGVLNGNRPFVGIEIVGLAHDVRCNAGKHCVKPRHIL